MLHSRFNRYNQVSSRYNLVSAAGTYNQRHVQSWWITQFSPQTVLCKRHSNVKGERLIYPNVSNAEAKPNLMSDARWVQWATRPPLCRSAFPPPRPPWSAGNRLISLCQLKKWSKNAGTSRSAVVTGWGRTSERSRPASVLREVSVSFSFHWPWFGITLPGAHLVQQAVWKNVQVFPRFFSFSVLLGGQGVWAKGVHPLQPVPVRGPNRPRLLRRWQRRSTGCQGEHSSENSPQDTFVWSYKNSPRDIFGCPKWFFCLP